MRNLIHLKIVVILFFFGLNLSSVSAGLEQINIETPNIIPLPNTISMGEGYFSFEKKTVIAYADNSLKEVSEYLQKALQKDKNINVAVKSGSKASNNTILLEIKNGLGNEGYKLNIENKHIVCSGGDEAGVFYAVQSLIQSVVEKDKGLKIPAMMIEDKPLYSWRGFMLDEARHFFGKETVKQYLDVMARLKLNRFHWHLTDEPGWRIEIKKYPLLTKEGSIGSWSDKKAASAFYTQEEIKEIVEYARQRHIMVIPEIDMPGHATAATRSYPYLSGGGEGKWVGFTFHPTKESTYEFIDDVLTEIAELFPAPYIHIGGDEVHYGNQSWFTDPQIQQFIKDNNLKNEAGLEHYFVRRVSEIILKKNRKMIGWDEIINAGVTPDKAIIMWWRHDKPNVLTQALNNGFDVIMCPRIPCYFDFVQDDSQKIGRRWGGKFNPLDVVYNFPESLGERLQGKESQIMGLQANIWTERVKDKLRLDYMVFPRLLAMAEDGWTKPQTKNYESFEGRIKTFMEYLKSLNINFFNPFNKESTPEPWGPDKEDVIANG